METEMTARVEEAEATLPHDAQALSVWWEGSFRGSDWVVELWRKALDGESDGAYGHVALQECQDHTAGLLASLAAARAELARLRKDLQVAKAEGIRWANAAEFEQGRVGAAFSEIATLRAELAAAQAAWGAAMAGRTETTTKEQ